MISDCSFRVLIGLWLLASEDKGKDGGLPPVDDIAFRLRIEKPTLISALEELGPFLVRDDIDMISDRYQDDVPETETETEGEGEGEAVKKKQPPKPKKKSGVVVKDLPDGVSEKTAKEFIEHRVKMKKPLTQEAFNRAMKAAAQAASDLGITPDRAITETIDAGWQGVKSDWLSNRLGKQNEGEAPVRRI
jgi:hypothetical protein